METNQNQDKNLNNLIKWKILHYKIVNKTYIKNEDCGDLLGPLTLDEIRLKRLIYRPDAFLQHQGHLIIQVLQLLSWSFIGQLFELSSQRSLSLYLISVTTYKDQKLSKRPPRSGRPRRSLFSRIFEALS